MKPLIITSMLATMCLLLLHSPVHAWQPRQDDPEKTAPDDASSEQVQNEGGELSREGWRHVIVLLKAKWNDLPDREAIREDLKSACTVTQFEWLQSLDVNALDLGPSLVFGRPGYVAEFRSANELGEQIAWLRQHQLIKEWVYSEEIADGLLLNAPVIKTLAAKKPDSPLVWKLRIMDDQVSADYIQHPFRRLQINRVLCHQPEPDSNGNQVEPQCIDVTTLGIGTELAGEAPGAYVTHFLPLQRDDLVRRQLANDADAVAFLIAYPDRSDFNRVLNDSGDEDPAKAKLHFEPGDFKGAESEQIFPTHGWEETSQVAAPIDAPSDATDLDSQIKRFRGGLKRLDREINSRAVSADPNALRRIVKQMFDTRQRMHRLEAQRMRQRLQLIEANLDAREKSRDTIIDQHFRKLFRRSDEPATIQESKGSGNDAVTSMPRGHVAPSMPQVPRNSVAETAIGIPEDTIQSPDLKFTKEYPLDRVSGAISGAGQWNETLLIRKSLADKRVITKDVQQELSDIQSRLMNYKKPLAEWSEEDKQEYSEAVQAIRIRFSAKGSTRKYDRDLQRVRDLNHDRYVREGILSKVFGIADPGVVSEMSATTDEMLDGIRLDLVRALESRQTSYHSTFERALAEWKETWNAYQSRLRLLKLDVEEAKLAFESRTAQNEQVRKQVDLGSASVSEVQNASSVLTAARFALLRAEELLKLYADIETQEPDLNPDSFKAEK